MRRFYAHPRQFHQDMVTLDPEETFHLARVLRLGVRVEVCDGEGGFCGASGHPGTPGAHAPQRLDLIEKKDFSGYNQQITLKSYHILLLCLGTILSGHIYSYR